MSDQRKIRVFVYGTLQQGEYNHRVIQAARYLRSASTEAAFSLYDLGPFPALVLGGVTAVAGEVYEVSPETLASLDQFEGCPRMYQRVTIELDDGGHAEAYVQRLDQVRGRSKIASGSWCDYRREQRCAYG